MSFKNKSAHERWVAYRDKMGDSFAPLICVKLDSLKEKSFEEYLRKGEDPNFRAKLTGLSDEDFLMLERIVNGWYDFQEHYEPFHSERIKRFNRYG